jgi:hypothetical protein
MAKGRSKRTRVPELLAPPPVRIIRKARPSQPNATLKTLLAAPGRIRHPGSIAVYSGVAQASANTLLANASDVPLPGWSWERWWIDAPPAGSQVLWLTLELATQWWHWDSCITARNNTGRYKYADFGINWHWMLLPDQYYVPGAPASMGDSGTYEFYASQAPGATTWTAWWVHPSRSVTLTPEGKESDPNALALLLRSEASGRLHFMFASDFPWAQVTFNGVEASCYSIGGGPRAGDLHYSMGVALPRAGVIVGDLQVPDAEPSKAPRRVRRIRRR